MAFPIFSWEPQSIMPKFYVVEICFNFERLEFKTTGCSFKFEPFKQGINYTITIAASNGTEIGKPSDPLYCYQGD